MSAISYDEYLGLLEQQYRLPPGLGRAQMAAESGGNPQAVSPAGAVGLFQFMPQTARRFGIDPRDPIQAAQGWARYMRENLDRFGDLEQAVAAYNAGEGAVERYKGVPPYKETQTYVQRVLGALTPVQGAQAAPAQDVPAQQGLQQRYAEIKPRLQALEQAGASPYEIEQALTDELGIPMREPLGPGARVLHSIVNNAPLIAGAGASLAAPTIATGALAGGLTTGLTRFLMSPQEPAQAAVEGASTAAGSAALGYGLQGLGRAVGHVLPGAGQRISEWAASHGFPSPPASRIGRSLQRTAQLPLAGELMARRQGRAMIEAAEREARALSGGAVPDAANVANKAQQFFDSVAKGEKAASDALYEGVRAAVGAEVPVSTPATLAALGRVTERLRGAGVTPETASPLARKLFEMADDAARTGRTTRVWRDFYSDYQGVLKAVTGKRSDLKDVAPELARAMEADIQQLGSRVGIDLLGLHRQAGKTFSELQGLLKGTNIKKLAEGVKSPDGYLRTLLTEPNVRLLERLRGANPALHQEILEAGIAAAIAKSSKIVEATGERLIQGPALHKWVSDNERWLRLVYGPERTQALANFASWAARAYPEMALSASGINTGARLTELGTMAGAAYKMPLVGVGMGLTQAGAAWMARSLTSPNGTLFRVFSGLPPPRSVRGAGAAIGNLLTPSLGPTSPVLDSGRR